MIPNPNYSPLQRGEVPYKDTVPEAAVGRVNPSLLTRM